MDTEKLKQIIEAALMVADEALSLDDLVRLFAADGDGVAKQDVARAVSDLESDYSGRGVQLVEVASGYRFQARTDLAEWVNRVWEERPPRYSRALLETLAIIAYRQPVTRGEIESIRGVAVSTNIIRTLSEREWIRVAGHRDVPGRPAVYATTAEFLDYFNLKSLAELPELPEIRDVRDVTPDLFGPGGEGAAADDAAASGQPLADVPVAEVVTGAEASPADDDSKDGEADRPAAVGDAPAVLLSAAKS